MNEISQTVLTNLYSVGIGLAIFLCAYLANMSFSIYYNIKILGETFSRNRIINSAIKITTFGFGVTLLTLAITTILPWATSNGLPIPEEYNEIISTVAILGICLVSSLKYIAEAFSKMKKILNNTTDDSQIDEWNIGLLGFQYKYLQIGGD